MAKKEQKESKNPKTPKSPVIPNIPDLEDDAGSSGEKNVSPSHAELKIADDTASPAPEDVSGSEPVSEMRFFPDESAEQAARDEFEAARREYLLAAGRLDLEASAREYHLYLDVLVGREQLLLHKCLDAALEVNSAVWAAAKEPNTAGEESNVPPHADLEQLANPHTYIIALKMYEEARKELRYSGDELPMDVDDDDTATG